ncbi:MAG TPA: CHAT domain-containing protein [Thermoanaerobaculia bacterium]|jgi:tetratricopeptide (TPR) repeat protein|nr:CHAT domain-containing protein [Thermoanaerobaculia bacterium]
MSLPDRAGQVLDLMVQRRLGEFPLLFICHSLGGLLIKQILRTADDAVDDPRKKQVAAQTRAVLFLATPHNGAELATLLDAFRTVFGTTVSIDDLRLHDAHLLNLYNWYRNHSPALGIRTVTYYEKRPVKGLLSIVNATSAQPGVGADAVPLDEDHLSIAKPRDRDEQVCDAARDLLRDYVLAPHPATAPKPAYQSERTRPVAVAGGAGPTKDEDRREGGDRDRVKMTRILFLASSPETTSRLDLEDELSSVENELGGVRFRDEIELTTGHAVRPDDLVRFLRRLKPTIVHFSGHGSPQGILLRSETGHTVVSGEALAQLFRDRHVDLIVLNACYSENQASLLTEVVQAVIGTTDALGDEAARRFSTAFYRTLGDGHPLKDALRDGKDAVAVHGLVDVFHGSGNLNRSLCGPNHDLPNDYIIPQPAAALTHPKLAPVTAAAEPQRLIVQLQGPAAAGESIRIPCDLPPAAERHFGRKTELKRLIKRLRAGKNSAVVGPAGIGKTALAAEAVCKVIGDSLATSPFPDGVVFLDLYTYRGLAEPAWNNLANALAGTGFMDTSPARERAAEACRARRALIIIEGGEEADEENGRTSIQELCSVFSSQNRRLLLTRLSTQTVPAESVELKEALPPADAADLLDSLTQNRVTGAVWDQILALVEGHPLALTWAGGLLSRDDDDPVRMVNEWQSDELPSLSDPKQAEHTLEWLFDRSFRGLDDTARQLLAAAGLLARAPFPIAAMVAALDNLPESVPIARIALKLLVQRCLLRRSEEPDHWQFTHVLGYRFARKETGPDPTLRERLGRWLCGHLIAVTGASFDHEGALSLTRALEHAAALLRADYDQQLWTLLANDLLYVIFARLRAVGRLESARFALRTVADWLDRIPAVKAQEPYWLWQRCSLRDRQGDVLIDQGDPTGALTAYQEALALSRRWNQVGPLNADVAISLIVSLNKVGDALRDVGDFAGSLVSHQESLTVIQRLVEGKASNADLRRQSSISQDGIGDVLRHQGDFAEALAAYRKSQEELQLLLKDDPSNAVWQRDLTVTQSRIARVLSDLGDWGGALLVNNETLVVRRRLVLIDPSDAVLQRDLSFSLAFMAALHERQGNRSEALPLAEESLKIDERLAALDPTNVSWRNDVAVSRALVVRLRSE